MKIRQKLRSLLLFGLMIITLSPLLTVTTQAADSDVRLVYFMDGTGDGARVIETKLLYEGDTLNTAGVVYREAHEEPIGWFSDKPCKTRSRP